MDLGIKGKKAIVCAASKGLGKGCAAALAREGVDVTICARSADAWHATAKEIGALAVKVTPVVCDVTTEKGRADLLAACPEPRYPDQQRRRAAAGRFQGLLLDDWRKAVEGNMLAPIALIHATIYGMMQRGFGRIVNIMNEAGRHFARRGLSQRRLFNHMQGRHARFPHQRSPAAPDPSFLPVAALAALPAGVTKGASVEGITEYRLANGLKVLLFPDATKPTTTVNVTYKVGSRHENYGETGMAHLLEHMLFKGTPTIPSVFAELGRRGMQFNGTTSYDRTNYFETFTASQPTLDWALTMEAERMTRSTFSKADLDSEMTVVRNEYESGENSPQSVLWKRMAAVAFDWHNYGKPTIGARSDIENVAFERLRAFYRDVLPAGQRGADHRRASSTPTRRSPRSPGTSARSRSRRACCRSSTRSSRCRTASAPSRCAASAARSGSARCSTCRRAPTRTRRRSRRWREIMTVEPAGRLYKALVESQEGVARRGLDVPAARPGLRDLLGAGSRRPSRSTPARDTMLATLYDVARAADHRRRARSRAHQGAEGLRRHDQRSAADGASRSPSRSPTATGGCSSSSATGGAR